MLKFREFLLQGEAVQKKSRRKVLIQVLISVLFVSLIYGTTDLAALLGVLKTITWTTAIAIAGLYLLGQIISAFKWRIIFQRVGISRSFGKTLIAYLLGMFVNTFGLGTIGGDVTRGVALRPKKGQRAAALGTVVADRIHGLVVLVLIGSVAIIVVRPEVFGPFSVLLSWCCIALVLLGWLVGPKFLTEIFPAKHRFGFAADQIARTFPLEWKPLVTITAISVLFHFVQIGIHLLLAGELSTPLTFAYLCATVPLINIVSSLPISVNGVGVREAMCVLLFVPIGVPQETAVAFGTIWIVVVTVVSAVGGFIAGLAATRVYSEEEAVEFHLQPERIETEQEHQVV